MARRLATVQLDEGQRRALLEALGFTVNSDGMVVSRATMEPIICRYSKKPVAFKDASVLPGSTVIINSSILTMAEYATEFLESE